MEYEFKEYIRDEILSNINHMNILDDALEELDHVYAQASKAGEYEAKAEAFDHIENLVKTELTSDDLYNDARNNDYVAGMLRVYGMIDYIIEEYERGEYDD